MRDKRLDVLKGIGIFIMVYRHAYAPFSNYFLLFHMAIFFIASGYLFKPESVATKDGLIKYTKRKILHLWLPYFVFTSLFVLLNNFFIKINFYTTNPEFLTRAAGRYVNLGQVYSIKDIAINLVKAVFMRTSTEIGGALWFFQALFYLTVGYGIIEFILNLVFKSSKRQAVMICQAVISVVFLILGGICSAKHISAFGLDRFFSCYIMFFLGQLIRKYSANIEKCWHGWLSVALFAVFLAVSLVLRKYGMVDMSANSYPNPLFLVAASIVGWVLYFLVATLVEGKIPFLSKILQSISKKSMFIVGLHFVAFKLASVIYILVMHEPWYMLASFPVITYSGAWWILYIIFGITLTMGIAAIYEFLKKKIIKK